MKTVSALLIVWCSVIASAQVKISIPKQHYKSRDKVDVEITNTGTSDVTLCVEYGYISYIDPDHTEPSPTPVYVQQKGAKGWSTLLTGPDIGSTVAPVTLHSGQSQHFPFRVNAHGTVRLILEYGFGSNQRFCEDRKSKKVARSPEFSIE